MVVVLLAFAALGARVIDLQVLNSERYEALALDQRLRTIPLPAARGSIFDRSGRDLAISIERPSVYADPKLVSDPAMYASRLAPVVGVDQQQLYERLSRRERRFVYVARTVDDAVADQVRALGLPGVGFVPEPLRRYPAGTVAAAVVGQVGGEGFGLDGLEYLYDGTLTGTAGELVVERDQRGRDIPDTERSRVGAQRGTDLVLTIDQAFQYEVEQTIVDQVTATEAKGGMAIVVDMRTGDVLAMVTVQGATGASPARVAVAGEKNRPLTDLLEPGSTSKLITIASAIEHGAVGPHTEFDVPVEYYAGGHPYRDTHRVNPMERWSTADIIRESSNVGTIKIAQALGAEGLDRALRDFGFGEKTAIDFPGQENGIVTPLDEYYATGLSSIAIGYSVAVTPMQMLDVYTTIANGGVSLPPRLVDATIDADGDREAISVKLGERIVSEATAVTMTEMLTDVVRGGTGACGAIAGHTVAGKTGTARIPVGGAYSDLTKASFIGYAPADDPRLAAIVVIEEPVVEAQFGARAAAPAFAEIVQFGLTHMRVPPTATGLDTQYDAAQARVREAGLDCSVPHGGRLTQVLADRQAARAAEAARQAALAAAPLPVTDPAAVAPDTLPVEPSEGD
ncbi:MAG: peptidoglycan D,D-transpeptidase FtsI family protein [Actinomycetota bacterium]